MQQIIQIYSCLLKLSRKQESVTGEQTDGQTATIIISPHRYRRGILNYFKIIMNTMNTKWRYGFNMFSDICNTLGLVIFGSLIP